ncbi:MAG: thiamine pyrophosphate-dependent enzyme, partial [Gammaproteobacteria bacterium]
HEGLRAQLSFPNRHPSYRGRVPFTAKETAALLAPHDLVFMIGGPFFEDIWHDDSSPFPAEAKLIQIENNAEQLAFNFPLDLGVNADLEATLGKLIVALQKSPEGYKTGASARNARLLEGCNKRHTRTRTDLEKVWDQSPMAALRALHEIAQSIPQGSIVVDESITSFSDVARQFDFRRPGDYFAGRGGGIGQGIAGAIGTQVAFPDRRVVALSGDGSAMYSIQALWTAVHHQLPIIFVIMSNAEYRVLKHNLDTYRHRFDIGFEKPYPHMDLSNPRLGFSDMAKGMGMDGEVVTDASDVAAALDRALQTGRPYLLEVIVAGKS